MDYLQTFQRKVCQGATTHWETGTGPIYPTVCETGSWVEMCRIEHRELSSARGSAVPLREGEGQEERRSKVGHMWTSSWFTLYSRFEHSIAKQLYPLSPENLKKCEKMLTLLNCALKSIVVKKKLPIISKKMYFGGCITVSTIPIYITESISPI